MPNQPSEHQHAAPVQARSKGRESRSRRTLSSVILQPLILPILLLAGVATTVVIGVERSAQTAEQVDQTQERMNILVALSKDVAQLENGERGFVITGDNNYLQPYLDAKQEFAQHVAHLRNISNIALQQQNLRRLEQKVQQWDLQTAQPEIQARRRSVAEAVARVQTGVGKRQLDEARAILNTMQFNENVRQTSAIAANTTMQRNVRTITLGGLGLGMLLLVLSTLRAAQTVTRGVGAFAESAGRIAAGRYDLRLPPTGIRELDTLGRQYHRMAEAVQQRQHQLEDSARELQQSNENLTRSNRELERFAYVASHDLQEPLRTIGSYTELIAKRYKGQLDSRADQYIDFTISATQRLKNLIQDLLTFSRVHRPGRTFTQVDTAKLVAEVVQELAAKIERAGATVNVEPLPTLRGNAELLHHIFLNLMTNAVKFRSADRPAVVQISAKRRESQWEFIVKDNGIGIAPEYNQKIFEVFQRLHGVGEYEGSGIGLAVTRSATEQHGGQIWLESTPGQGSTFYFTVPDQLPKTTPTTETPRT